MRAYYDRNDVATGSNGTAQENVGLFAGIKLDELSIGAEYMSLYNAKRVNGEHQHGYSVYSTVKLPRNFEVYGRWDYLFSTNDYNINKDGQLGIIGLQYSVNKHVQISPNFRVWQPALGGAAKMEALINLHVNL